MYHKNVSLTLFVVEVEHQIYLVLSNTLYLSIYIATHSRGHLLGYVQHCLLTLTLT
jgi:hypothetical protein